MSFTYEVTPNTGHKSGDGTDENVLIRLYGFDGKVAGDYYCDLGQEDDFEYNNTHFTYNLVTDEYIGDIQKILVYVRPNTEKPVGPAWDLCDIDVKYYVNGQEYNKKFQCNRWIGIRERGSDGHDVHQFVECYREGSKVFDSDPEGEKKYDIISAHGGAIYPCSQDPTWKNNKRPVISSEGHRVDYCD
ncbi:PLAT/LH2 domain-containing protein (plasmid) [Priestia megaterium]|uniref:PLAT/LH2 domain-containing protein n=1 Tax=Priestia megaterium TaxID=1404 RepID=UPI00389A0B1F